MLPAIPDPGQPLSAAWARQLLEALAATRLFADRAGRLPGGSVLDQRPTQAQAHGEIAGDGDLLLGRSSLRMSELIVRGLPWQRRYSGAMGLSGFLWADWATPKHGRLRHVVREELPGGKYAVRYAPAYVRAQVYVSQAFLYDASVLLVAARLRNGAATVETVYMQGETPGPREYLRRVAGDGIHVRGSAALVGLPATELELDICVGWYNAFGTTPEDAVQVSARWAGQFVFSGYVAIGGANRDIDFDHPLATVTLGGDSLGIEPFGGSV